MKQILIGLCVILFACAVNAQENKGTPGPENTPLPEGSVLLPLVTLCSPIEPDMGLYKRYGEVPFVDADAMFYIPGNKTVNGKITIFMKPGFEDNTYTLMFNVGPMYCMISSGKNMLPAGPESDPT